MKEDTTKDEESNVSCEQWQLDAVAQLLNDTAVDEKAARVRVSENRLYLQSRQFSESRYHVVFKDDYDRQFVIEQIDADNRYMQRLTLQADELPGLLGVLLRWHLEAVQQDTEASKHPYASSDLGDLDDHPF